ncbi:universal stress protein [Nocardioides lijunqiniae]|uniref:universal stress protein n=1 Tax=Nocardioides lijunqiniae TaxID=2760832 RepID=UPI001877BC12|nr:universal stress protein [Nocardioides lijunqiniae]
MNDATPVPHDAIVVGLDGSQPAATALDWAAEQAALEGRPLVLVHAAPPLGAGAAASLGSLGVDTARLREEVLSDAHALLDRAAERVADAHDGLVTQRLALVADPRQTLLELAAPDRLLVVGSRGMGPVRSLLLGSVSLALTKHAPGPVVVVRPTEGPRSPGGVLVAVALDGTDAPVLDLAFRFAATRGLPLTALHCFWDMNEISRGAVDVPDDEPGLEELRDRLAAALADHRAAYPSVPVHPQLTRGFVDARVLDATRRADLVVLGHQPKPRLGELVYGSVAPQVVEAGQCSVAVVGRPEAAG